MRPEPALSFRPVTANDLPLIAGWMAAPHWRRWWGDPETELGHIRDMVEGRDTTRPYLFLIDGAPAGYIQVWFVGDHQTEVFVNDHPWLAELPAETVGVDLAIGKRANLSKGIGSRVLRAFVAKLRAEGHGAIIIDPDPRNARALRAYQKAGFRPVPRLLGRTGDCLILRHQHDGCDLSP